MAFVLPLGKLTILVGAGIFGSVLAKEKQMPSVSDVLSTTFKFIKPSGSSSSSTKPKDDALLAQVNSLKQELQFLVSNRPVTIVTSGGGGGRPYGVIILVVAVGYGYIWWKGWKLPDLTFATKSSLKDACTSIAKQLEEVYSSIRATKRDLSSRIDRADCNVDDLAEVNVSTRNEVSLLQGELGTFDVNIQSVREVVESLESRILNMQENEDAINYRVMRLVEVANTQGAPTTASRPAALENPPTTLSLPPPPALSLEPPPLSSGSNEDIEEISQAASSVLSSPVNSNGQGNGSPATGGFFGRMITSNIPFISRTRSTTQ